MSDNKRMGSSNVDTSTLGIRFADGTYQTTAAVADNAQANTLQAGVAVCTSQSVSVTFASPYVATKAPIVVVTGIDGFDTHGIFTSVSAVGSASAWTGFTVNLSGTFFGAFNWVAIGNPN